MLLNCKVKMPIYLLTGQNSIIIFIQTMFERENDLDDKNNILAIQIQ